MWSLFFISNEIRNINNVLCLLIELGMLYILFIILDLILNKSLLLCYFYVFEEFENIG